MIAYILDAELQSALAAVRSLGRRGIRVVCGSTRETAMSFVSRFTAESFCYADPLVDQVQFVEDVAARIAQESDRVLVYTFSDATAMSLLMHAQMLPKHATVPGSDVSDPCSAFDKRALLAWAATEHIGVPTQYAVDSLEALSACAAEMVYPVIVKPHMSVIWVHGQGVQGTAALCECADALMRTCEEQVKVRGVMPLIQQRVQGTESGYFALAKQGKVLLEFAHKRLRSISPHGGASTLRESIAIDPTIRTQSQQIIAHLGWTGPIMIEWKQDTDGVWKLMEANPRFWGSLPLALHAGVDFPYALYQHFCGETVDMKSSPYRLGVQSRHLLADVKHLMMLCGGHYPLIRKLKGCLSFLLLWKPRLKYDVLSLHDPKPFFAEVRDAWRKQKFVC